MKKSLFTLLLAFCIGAFNASADKKVMNVKSSYTALHVATAANVVYTPESSKQTVIEIIGPAEKINWVDVSVSNNTLHIRVKEDKDGSRNGYRIKGVTINVNGPLVRSFRASSSGKITSSTWFEFRKSTVSLNASSSGEIKLANISSPAIVANASSSGEIDIKSANSPSINLSASSSADIEIKSVQGKSLTAKASSSADIEISTIAATTVTLAASSSADVEVKNITAEKLNASASSSGDIKVIGTVDRALLSASSGGDVDAKNLSYSHSTIRSSSGGSVYER